jgi:hypothetical protein
MAFTKHVGKHGDRKVAIVFRQIPGEEHMCLCVYTELLNQNIHDPLIKAIETPQAQQALDLAEQLNKSFTRDGKIILQVLHGEGMMKKVKTEEVMMTPAPNQFIKLNELNKLLNEMEQGEAAVKRLAEIDASRGLQDPQDIARRMRGETPAADRMMGTSNPQGAMGDNDIANNLRNQAAKMESEAKGLLAEAARLAKEASMLDGVQQTVAEIAPEKRGRGRPKKVAA